MLLDQLLYEINVHYRSRGFPESALEHLRWTLITSTSHYDVIDLSTAYHNYKVSVSDLIGYFKPAAPLVTEEISSAQAVFGFAFGYQMASWSLVHKPADRLPGPNNEALADIVVNLNSETKLPLYLQFEIVKVYPNLPCFKNGFTSEEKDQGTINVAKEFVKKIEHEKAEIKTVVIVAHRHHVERCRLILNNGFNLNGLPYDVQYDGYDPLEAQPRVMSSSQCIVSDFVSMVAMKRRFP